MQTNSTNEIKPISKSISVNSKTKIIQTAIIKSAAITKSTAIAVIQKQPKQEKHKQQQQFKPNPSTIASVQSSINSYCININNNNKNNSVVQKTKNNSKRRSVQINAKI